MDRSKLPTSGSLWIAKETAEGGKEVRFILTAGSDLVAYTTALPHTMQRIASLFGGFGSALNVVHMDDWMAWAENALRMSHWPPAEEHERLTQMVEVSTEKGDA